MSAGTKASLKMPLMGSLAQPQPASNRSPIHSQQSNRVTTTQSGTRDKGKTINTSFERKNDLPAALIVTNQTHYDLLRMMRRDLKVQQQARTQLPDAFTSFAVEDFQESCLSSRKKQRMDRKQNTQEHLAVFQHLEPLKEAKPQTKGLEAIKEEEYYSREEESKHFSFQKGSKLVSVENSGEKTKQPTQQQQLIIPAKQPQQRRNTPSTKTSQDFYQQNQKFSSIGENYKRSNTKETMGSGSHTLEIPQSIKSRPNNHRQKPFSKGPQKFINFNQSQSSFKPSDKPLARQKTLPNFVKNKISQSNQKPVQSSNFKKRQYLKKESSSHSIQNIKSHSNSKSRKRKDRSLESTIEEKQTSILNENKEKQSLYSPYDMKHNEKILQNFFDIKLRKITLNPLLKKQEDHLDGSILKLQNPVKRIKENYRIEKIKPKINHEMLKEAATSQFHFTQQSFNSKQSTVGGQSQRLLINSGVKTSAIISPNSENMNTDLNQREIHPEMKEISQVNLKEEKNNEIQEKRISQGTIYSITSTKDPAPPRKQTSKFVNPSRKLKHSASQPQVGSKTTRKEETKPLSKFQKMPEQNQELNSSPKNMILASSQLQNDFSATKRKFFKKREESQKKLKTIRVAKSPWNGTGGAFKLPTVK